MERQWEPSEEKATWDNLAEDIAAWDEADLVRHLPNLLVWLQDLNWPGARRVADVLMALGAPVLPPVRLVLQGSDRGWQYWVLTMLVGRWPRDLVAQLEPELNALAYLDTHAAEVDVLALAQLARHHLIEPGALDRLIAHKRAAYLATPYLLDWLEPDHPSEQ